MSICITASKTYLASGVSLFIEFMLLTDAPFCDEMDGVRRVISLRDPVTLLVDGTYYINVTESHGYYCYAYTDLIYFEGPFLVCDASTIPGAHEDFWAPECHRYNSGYYLFATMRMFQILGNQRF